MTVKKGKYLPKVEDKENEMRDILVTNVLQLRCIRINLIFTPLGVKH